jgi:hypothetical protein
MTRITHTATFHLCEQHDDHAFAALTLAMTFDVTFGDAPSGHGEHYDPGSGDEIRLWSLNVTRRSGLMITVATYLANDWLAIDANRDTIANLARQQNADARDDAVMGAGA